MNKILLFLTSIKYLQCLSGGGYFVTRGVSKWLVSPRSAVSLSMRLHNVCFTAAEKNPLCHFESPVYHFGAHRTI